MGNPFANWTPAQVELHNARVTKRTETVEIGGDSVGWKAKVEVKRERDLHSLIFDECRRRGWIAFHGSMAERTHRTCGEPDFVILADSARLLMVECKMPNGKLSTEQQAMIAHAKKLGHQIHVVRSFQEFLNLL